MKLAESGTSRGAPRPLVQLVGAGPGDPELLTIKAVRAIRRATVLLVDDLVGPGVLAYARKSARVVHVGKRGGCASTSQAFIERLMAAEALRGERVVRLKGGDPNVFGRGGEEAEHLRSLGIEVEVVNGITAGLAAATAIDVPLTHREHAHGVMFITGHARRQGQAGAAEPRCMANAWTHDGGSVGEPALHWPTIAAAAAEGITLVIYMGIATAQALQDGLLGGLPAATPVAIVQHASLPQQRDVRCRLDELAAVVHREAIGSPAIIVVGDVVQAHRSLAQAAHGATARQAGR